MAAAKVEVMAAASPSFPSVKRTPNIKHRVSKSSHSVVAVATHNATPRGERVAGWWSRDGDATPGVFGDR